MERSERRHIAEVYVLNWRERGLNFDGYRAFASTCWHAEAENSQRVLDALIPEDKDQSVVDDA